MSNNSGPAFPLSGMDYRNGHTVQSVYSHGMTLRDYFAAKALVGLLSDTANVSSPELFAKVSYQHADAMLAERAK